MACTAEHRRDVGPFVCLTACAATLEFFDSLRAPDAEQREATLAAAWTAVASAAERGILLTAAVAAGLALLSWPLGAWMARSARAPAGAAK